MFKWFKEIFVDSIKEGIDEAKQEVAEEKEKERISKKENAEKERAAQEENRLRILAIPYPEKFAVSIAAPFRAVYLSGWSPVFENNESDGRVTWPLSLYSFGEANSITEEKRKALKELIARDFDITSQDSATKSIASLLLAGNISTKLEKYADEESQTFNAFLTALREAAEVHSNHALAVVIAEERSLKALLCCMAAYAITSSVDCGYLEKSLALELLGDVTTYVKADFTGWKNYSDEFLTGEKSSKLNNAVGRRFLVKYVEYLHKKPGSPWRNVEWTAVNAQRVYQAGA
jgi:hypothetical protein